MFVEDMSMLLLRVHVQSSFPAFVVSNIVVSAGTDVIFFCFLLFFHAAKCHLVFCAQTSFSGIGHGRLCDCVSTSS